MKSFREIVESHQPIPFMGGGQCWIQCSCGWNPEGFQTSGEEWTEHILKTESARHEHPGWRQS